MEIELHRIELRYLRLRIDDTARRARLLASLAEHGQQSPVLVIGGGAEGYVLIDGYNRVRALAELGFDVVQATVVAASEPDALILAHRLDHTRRRSAIEEGWLVDELIGHHGFSLRQVATRLQRSVSWASRRLALVRELPMQVHSGIRSGHISAHAAMRCLVPLARANRAQCVKLVERLGHHQVSVRQLEQIYNAWRSADAEGRERIVEKPRLLLRAEEERAAQTQPQPGDPAEPVVRDLEVIGGVCQRLRRRVREGLLGTLDESRRALVGRTAEQTRMSFDLALEALREPAP
jgi:ParB family transcriptional regulator, chromosome partitioning protein